MTDNASSGTDGVVYMTAIGVAPGQSRYVDVFTDLEPAMEYVETLFREKYDSEPVEWSQYDGDFFIDSADGDLGGKVRVLTPNETVEDGLESRGLEYLCTQDTETDRDDDREIRTDGGRDLNGHWINDRETWCPHCQRFRLSCAHVEDDGGQR